MKISELLPTEENVRETYLNDTIGRDNDVNAFVDILNSLENASAIALDGAWGSGKTFFVRQVKMILDSCCSNNVDNDYKQEIRQYWINKHNGNEPDFQSQLCVYYDAWENDNDEDPVLSLVYSILQDVDAESPFEPESGLLDKGAAIAECLSGRNITAVVESLKGADALADLRKKKEIQTQVKEFFDELLEERANRLVVIIDELDRCKPEFAVRLLERVKHYFADDRITFVFSTNINELQHTISKFYGNGFDAVRYFDRFFDLRIALPPVNIERYLQSIDFGTGYVVDDVCYELIQRYTLSLREIARFLRLVKIAVYEPTHDSKKFDFDFHDGQGKLLELMYVVPLLIVLKMTDGETYNRFLAGENPEPLVELFERIRTKHDWKFDEFLSADEFYEATVPSSTAKKCITYKQKFTEIYDAIFGNQYNFQKRAINIGKYQFTANSRDRALKAVAALSVYANYEL